MKLTDIVNEGCTSNPHCKAKEGERKVHDHKHYVIFHSRDTNEHRGVLKHGSDDGAFEENLNDCKDTMGAVVKSLKLSESWDGTYEQCEEEAFNLDGKGWSITKVRDELKRLGFDKGLVSKAISKLSNQSDSVEKSTANGRVDY